MKNVNDGSNCMNDMKLKHMKEIKTYMLPPKSLEFNVTIMDPIHTITNTSANSGPPSLELSAVSDDPCNILFMNNILLLKVLYK